MITQIISLVLCLSAVCLGQGPSNQYLPPDKGYSYPVPPVGLPTGSGTVSQRPPPGPPAYTPRPSPPPSYGPPPSSPQGPPSPPPQPPTPGAPYPPAGPPAPPGGGNNQYGPDSHLNMPHVPGMPFEFDYAVNDPIHMAYYSHNAASDGDQVKGEYRVQLPDGRTQIVSYVADWATGFHADVKYEGEATYPAPAQAPYPGTGVGGGTGGGGPGGYPAPGPPPVSFPSPPGQTGSDDFQGYPAAGSPEGVTGGGY